MRNRQRRLGDLAHCAQQRVAAVYGRATIDHQRTLGTNEQVDERPFVVGALVLTQDPGVRLIADPLPFNVVRRGARRVAILGAVDPVDCRQIHQRRIRRSLGHRRHGQRCKREQTKQSDATSVLFAEAFLSHSHRPQVHAPRLSRSSRSLRCRLSAPVFDSCRGAAALDSRRTPSKSSAMGR